MDDDTVEEPQFSDDPIDTLTDIIALDVGDDTVVTSAAPPDGSDDAPWPDHLIHGAVSFASGSTRL